MGVYACMVILIVQKWYQLWLYSIQLALLLEGYIQQPELHMNFSWFMGV